MLDLDGKPVSSPCGPSLVTSDLNCTGLHSVSCSPSQQILVTIRKHFKVVSGNIPDGKESSGTGHIQEIRTTAGVCQCDGLSRGCIAHVFPGTRMWPPISIGRGIVGVRLAGIKGGLLGR